MAAAGIQRPLDEQGQPLPILNTAHSSYHSEANVQGVDAAGLDPYFAVSRQKHQASETDPLAGDSGSAADETPKAAMAKKVRTPTGRALDAARKHIVESVFGQIKRVRGFRKFHLRGLELVSAEWQLICLTHNLLNIWRHVSSLC